MFAQQLSAPSTRGPGSKRHLTDDRRVVAASMPRAPHALLPTVPAYGAYGDGYLTRRLAPIPAAHLIPLVLPQFPHGEEIRRRIGQPAPTAARLDPQACGREGVPGFAEAGIASFASPMPSLQVAAHEATHVLQQQGATRDMGLGAEAHAAAVERAVAGGGDARALFGPRGAAAQSGRSRYTVVDLPAQASGDWDAKMDVRVSEDGLMAVGQDSTQHHFWAESGRIAGSNATLGGVKSVIRLEPQADTITGAAPDGSGARTLFRVLPKNVSNSTTGENMNLWADCGKSGRDVMGAGEGTGKNSSKIAAVYNVPITLPDAPVWYKPWAWNAKGSGPDKETANHRPEEMKKEILKDKLGAADGDAALAQYAAMSAAERDTVDRQAGINRYAMPLTGEGYTMSSGGANIPGASTWNFHWAGVVMALGADHVTLENYSVSNPAVQNSDWEFQMYGSARKPGQTFYDQHKATNQHGDMPIAMRVRKTS